MFLEEIKILLTKIEKHCNNYFNPQNDPRSTIRDYPPDFLELAEQIHSFINSPAGQPSNITSESVTGLHSYSRAVTPDGISARWQTVFARDLSIYKRANFI